MWYKQPCTCHLTFNQREKRPAIRNQFGSSAPSAPLCRSSIFSKLRVYLAREIARNRLRKRIFIALSYRRMGKARSGAKENSSLGRTFSPRWSSSLFRLPSAFPPSLRPLFVRSAIVCRICRRACTLLPRFGKTRTIWTLVIRFGKNAKTEGLPSHPGTRGQLDPRPTHRTAGVAQRD